MVESVSDIIEWGMGFFIIGIISTILLLLTLFFGKGKPIVYGHQAINESLLVSKSRPMNFGIQKTKTIQTLNEY